MSVQLRIHSATTKDQQGVQRLLQEARRSYVAFGAEDLPRFLDRGACFVAARLDSDGVRETDELWALICATTDRSRWAYLRGAAVIDGYRTDDGIQAVMPALVEDLAARSIAHLAAYGTAVWLVPVLTRVGFERLDWIVTLERHARPVELTPPAGLLLRPVAAQDLMALAKLDRQIFEPPYQLASGELIELMITSGYFAVTVWAGPGQAEIPVGYVCTDIPGETGQIIRLAVHPSQQRQGIGRMLLNSALAYCHGQGARRIVLNTQESNSASLKLYEQSGFRRVGRRIPLLVRAVE
ncbi:MAG: GNAT family N-acetyltransferase [Chloroflexota bacterium]|nr:GNAT family N-acetyltransferase [Chloroflexota bacterium]